MIILEIKCPHCGNVIDLDQLADDAILRQEESDLDTDEDSDMDDDQEEPTGVPLTGDRQICYQKDL